VAGQVGKGGDWAGLVKRDGPRGREKEKGEREKEKEVWIGPNRVKREKGKRKQVKNYLNLGI
jgi:hypothetical protein